jgi:DNA polymerase-3 subunit gamma/tau
MALIRLAFAADLPAPEDALRRLAENSEASPPRLAPVAVSPSLPPRASALPGDGSALRAPAPANEVLAKRAPDPAGPRLARFEEVVALARVKRDIRLATALEADVRLARFEPGRIEFSLVEGASAEIVQLLSRRLTEWTGERWMVTIAAGASAPTLRETATARRDERFGEAGEHPVVRKVLERFPGAKVVDVSGPAAPPAAPSPPTSSGDDEVAYIDAHDDNDEL